MKKSLFVKSVVCIYLVMAFSVTGLYAGPRDHDGGFFLRLSTGGGYAQSEFGDPAAMKISGPGGDMNFAVGMGVLPNLSVHATIFGWLLSGPTVEIGGSVGEFPGDIMLYSLGCGVTYYIMPVNVYLSASVGAAVMSVEILGVTAETDIGPAFDVTLGKEWWVGGSWGLGVAGGFGYHSVPEQDVDENWSGYSLGVRFSATLN
jgi:hypothetical protein